MQTNLIVFESVVKQNLVKIINYCSKNDTL